MEEKEYLDKIAVLECEFKKQKELIDKEFVLKKAKFKKGDVIKYSDDIILIDKLSYYINSNKMPCPSYHGLILKKDLTPRKDKSRGGVYSNDAELLKRV